MSDNVKHYPDAQHIGPGDIISERIPTLCGLTQPHVEDFAGRGAATCADCVEIDRQFEAERQPVTKQLVNDELQERRGWDG